MISNNLEGASDLECVWNEAAAVAFAAPGGKIRVGSCAAAVGADHSFPVFVGDDVTVVFHLLSVFLRLLQILLRRPL